MMHQGLDILAPLPEWRHLDGHHAIAITENEQMEREYRLAMQATGLRPWLFLGRSSPAQPMPTIRRARFTASRWQAISRRPRPYRLR